MKILIKPFNTPKLGKWRLVKYEKGDEYFGMLFPYSVEYRDSVEWNIADAGVGTDSSDFETLAQAKRFVTAIKKIKKIKETEDEVEVVSDLCKKIKGK